jgi:hypothetical protein
LPIRPSLSFGFGTFHFVTHHAQEREIDCSMDSPEGKLVEEDVPMTHTGWATKGAIGDSCTWLGSRIAAPRIEAAILGALAASAIERGHQPEWVRRLCRLAKEELRRPGKQFRLTYFINRAVALVTVRADDKHELCLRLVAGPPASAGRTVGPCMLCCRSYVYRPGGRFGYLLIR